MMKPLSLDDRIEGSLIGAAIGAELGYYRYAYPERFDVATASELFGLELTKAPPDKLGPSNAGLLSPGTNRIWAVRSTIITALGVRAYLNKRGRVTPEDFGQELAADDAIACPAFALDALHTTQELLKEGIQPRIAGLGTAPHGLLVAAMPAVGIYHYGDPEYAYLDGVELASVAQPRLGADWAGLAAAAIASALDPQNSPEATVDTVLRLAHENNKEVFYELNYAIRQASRLPGSGDDADLSWWRDDVGRYDAKRRRNYVANNPLEFVLPLLAPFDGDARKIFTLLLWPDGGWIPVNHLINPVLAGAIVGARHGREAFDAAWLEWAEPIARPWYEIKDVVAERTRRETAILRECDTLAVKAPDGRSQFEDKVYGNLLAGAIGNAMGSATEALLYPEIDAKYPRGLTTIVDPRRLELEDDNQMAMFLVETYLRREGKPVLARHFGQTWFDRLNRDHFYPLCMGAVYDLIRSGWDPRVSGHWAVVTGSTVMCMEPVGIFHALDPEFAAIDATAISYMYQRGLDVVAATILAATVAEALRPDSSVESVCEAALAASPAEPWKTFDRRAHASCREYIEACLSVAEKYDDVRAARPELYEKCLLYGCIDPIELLGFSLAMFLIAEGDVRQAAIGGTNIGRDADTIAGRAAMLSGTLYGSAGVPRDWMALFSTDSLERIRANARRLTELVLDKKQATLRRRQTVAAVTGNILTA